MPVTRKQWRIAGTVLFLVLFAGTILLGTDEQFAATIVRLVGNAGRLPFFAAMTLLPMAGFPVTPFYLLGGAVFGEWTCLLGSAISLLINLVMGYAMAFRWMRKPLQSLLAQGGRRQFPDLRSRNAWLYILATRLTPGPPLSVKNYMAGLAGVPFGPYLLVSWPIAMGYAAGLIVLGDSLREQKWLGILAGALLIGVFLAVMRVLRTWLRKRLRTIHQKGTVFHHRHGGTEQS